MTAALSLSPSDTAEIAALRAEVHRLRTVIAAADVHIARMDQDARRLTQERDSLEAENVRLRASLGLVVANERRPAEITVYCNTPDCTTQPLTAQVAPPDSAVPQWVRGMGWTTDGEAHWCPRCQRGR